MVKTKKNKKTISSIGHTFSKIYLKCTTYINSIFNKLNKNTSIITKNKKSYINQKNFKNRNINYSLRKINNVDLINQKRIIKIPEKLINESGRILKKRKKKKIMKKSENFSIKRPIKKSTKKSVNKKPVNIKKNIVKRPPVKESTKLMIYEKQNDKCALCNKSLGIGRIIDHVLMRSLGGCDNINNYQGLCVTCNKWKTFHFDQFVRNYFKNNNKTTIDFNELLNLQKEQFNNFFGSHPIINIE